MSLGSGIQNKPIPGPWVKKAPDPGFATLGKLFLCTGDQHYIPYKLLLIS
jgi:hypothetical protein